MHFLNAGMYGYRHEVIRHGGVDNRMIILDDQARQRMTRHFQLYSCNVSPIAGFDRHTLDCPK